jgi:hypothetical protein
MAMLKVEWISRLALAAPLLGLLLSVTACATGPLGSHGVDYIPAFDTPPPNQ